MSESEKGKSSLSDLAGVGEIVNSQVAKWAYKDVSLLKSRSLA